MSSIAAISGISNAINPYLMNSTQPAPNQTLQDFQAIGNALLSGNLASAQTALSTFQQHFAAAGAQAPVLPFGNNDVANGHYQNLITALRSANLTGAQTAFAALQTDMKGIVQSLGASQSSLGWFTSPASAGGSGSSAGSTFGNILSKVLALAP
jgi:hypothetical protein